MFEIIMLFAFLYAAACQLFPERPVTTRTPFGKNRQSCKGKPSLPQSPPGPKDQKSSKNPVKAYSHNHNYAQAA